MTFKNLKKLTAAACLSACAFAMPMQAEAEEVTMEASQITDMLHAVMASDREVYTKMIIQRLVKKEKVLKASEHFEDNKAAPLPAQMFRFGSETTADKIDTFSYSLLSQWPINQQYKPKTPAEIEGAQYILDNPGDNYYGTEELGGQKYFTAIYPDVAVAEACATCHNEHKDSPKKDFEVGDIMGGVIIRMPID